MAGHDNLAFRNALYDETNRANSIIDRSSRQQMPLPTPTSTVAPDDLFNPVKPKLLPEDEEQGAVGGANPYQDIDGSYLDPVTCAMGTEQKVVVGQPVLDTRTLAGAGDDGDQKGASNPYADFEDLKRRSIAARQASGMLTGDVICFQCVVVVHVFVVVCCCCFLIKSCYVHIILCTFLIFRFVVLLKFSVCFAGLEDILLSFVSC